MKQRKRSSPGVSYLAAASVVALVAVGYAQDGPGTVLGHQKISDTEGGFTGILDGTTMLGCSSAYLGDLDGDGVVDLAAGAYGTSDGGSLRGGVWIMFLNPDGTVKAHQKISDTEGGFTGELDDLDRFGGAVGSMGDFDGDGVPDIAVGAATDDDGGTDRGAVWILLLNQDGTVKQHQKLSDTEGGFTGALHDGDGWGSDIDILGDLDGDGVADLAVGAWHDDGPSTTWSGSAWILFLNRDGTVKSHQKIAPGEGGFTGTLGSQDYFGAGLGALGDLDGDGVQDLCVGARGDDDGGFDHGALWVLFLNADGTVSAHQKISDTEGGFLGALGDSAGFGTSVGLLDDLDGDGIRELATGAHSDSDGGSGRGSVWILFLNRDGTVKAHQKVSDTEGAFMGELQDGDNFGTSSSPLGDLNGDGVIDLAVGAWQDDDGGNAHGAVWVLFLSDGECHSAVGEPYCFGNGSESPCPCGNETTSCAGCVNSTGAGAALYALGSTSVASDDLVLAATSVTPFQFGVFYMGSGPSEVPFGDGMRCVSLGGTGVFRYPVQYSGPFGNISMGPGVVGLSHEFPLAGHIAPGETWYFQAWYRDPGGPCGSFANLTNGLSVLFTP